MTGQEFIKQMNDDNNKVILIDALQGALTSEDVKELEECIVQEGICLEVHTHKPQYMNGIEDFFSQIQIICSKEVIFALVTGVFASGIYEALKIFLCKVYNKMKGRHVTKIQSGKVEEVQPKIHFIIGDVKVILPLDIDEEKYKYFVDKMFESMKDETITKKEFCIWNKETGEVEYYSKLEIARKMHLERSKNSYDKQDV